MAADRKKCFRACETGQALVEFTLVFSILLTLFCMAVDTARIVDTKILLQNAASESIRSITSKDDMESEVTQTLKKDYDRLDSTKMQVSVTGDSNQKRNYTYHAHNGNFRYVNRNSYFTYFDATVNLTYTLPILTPFGQLVFGKQKILSANYKKMVVTGGYSW